MVSPHRSSAREAYRDAPVPANCSLPWLSVGAPQSDGYRQLARLLRIGPILRKPFRAECGARSAHFEDVIHDSKSDTDGRRAGRRDSGR